MQSIPHADVFIPDNTDVDTAMLRTTHLAIGAHQDDIEFFAFHGISKCFAKSDKWFTGIVCSNGSGSPRRGEYAKLSDRELMNTRKVEQRKAASIGEYSAMIQLAYPSKLVKNPKQHQLYDDLVSILNHTKPDVVYIHNPIDRHPTHVAVALRSIAAIRSMPSNIRPKHTYGCEVWRDLDWLPRKYQVALPTSHRPHLQNT